jgi:hypothetical protein
MGKLPILCWINGGDRNRHYRREADAPPQGKLDSSFELITVLLIISPQSQRVQLRSLMSVA